MKLTSSVVATILLLSVSTSALPVVPEQSIEARSLLSGLFGTAAKDVAEDGAEDAAKVAGKAASGGILSHLKNAAVTGIEGLVGTEVVSKIADTVDPGLASGSSAVSGAQTNSTQTNSTDSSVEARSLLSGLFGTAAKDGAEDAAKVAEKSVGSGIFGHIKNAALAGVGSLVGGEVISKLTGGGADPSVSDAQANSTVSDTTTDDDGVEARSLLSGLFGTAAKDVAEDGAEDAAKVAGKAASGGILSHLKNAAVTGIEGLVGTEVVSKIADTVDPNLAGAAASDAQTNSTSSDTTSRRMVRLRREPGW